MENNRYREEEQELEETTTAEPKQTEETENVVEESDSEVVGDDYKLKKQNKKLHHRIKHLEEENKHLEEENQKLTDEVASLKDQLLRELAELENFKKRSNEERIRERKYALSDFLMELIDIIDIFDKAVSVQTDDEKLQKFLNGFMMVNKNIKQVLEKNGVKPIDALNKPFDPSYHSAIETVKVEGVEPNMVVEVIMTGYTYKDRVLRPSMVKVSE